MTSAYWLNDGKQFICSHSNGTLTVWNLKNSDKPVETLTPHGKECFSQQALLITSKWADQSTSTKPTCSLLQSCTRR